ncbi:hypothetical protein BU24DRAFT_61636 [Aaosphaeria arxii CBS 175.79]|uniref:Uncharacterized protein n=1 Tax=Aaosphaeria arxii CBS 175.79 TaxID=1450172 RepID=A0A6A5XCA9_9PLEO|nr:uncharacterized protein BU24DRAFT_61636 [Aaosphaeria arxii CBS 175.79]KAF2010608.1 hypothetical protein BU24DRAFT_61636 [Aaosphaeria arxii CBS 175.79]
MQTCIVGVQNHTLTFHNFFPPSFLAEKRCHILLALFRRLFIVCSFFAFSDTFCSCLTLTAHGLGALWVWRCWVACLIICVSFFPDANLLYVLHFPASFSGTGVLFYNFVFGWAVRGGFRQWGSLWEGDFVVIPKKANEGHMAGRLVVSCTCTLLFRKRGDGRSIMGLFSTVPVIRDKMKGMKMHASRLID